MLSVTNSDNITLTRPRLTAFLFFSVFAIIWILLSALVFRAGSFFFRQKRKYRRFLDLLAISLIYISVIEMLMLLTLALGNSGTVFLGISAFCILLLTSFLAMRNALELSEDQAILFTSISFIISTVLFRSLFVFSAGTVANLLNR